MPERPDDQVVAELCVELRHVGVRDYDLPDEPRVVNHVKQVKVLHEEILRRGIEIGPRLELLSKETRWQMRELMDDCLAFPEKVPYVREEDGIRRRFRCQFCRKAECPSGAKLFYFCNDCMRRVLNAIQTRVPLDGVNVILIRTYNAECRCAHATDDTVLAMEHNDFNLYGVCEKCILDELQSRNSVSNPPA